MAAIQLTLFNATETNEKPKVALSKNVDETFIFINKEAPDLKSMAMIMANYFVLNQPLNLSEPKVLNRRKKDLDPFKYKRIKNIVLDLDEIITKDDYLDIIEYFRSKNYSCILLKSRSNDNITNFNLKGILRVDFLNDEEIIKTALTQLQLDLGSMCKVDLKVAEVQAYNAPTHSKQIVYYKEKGKKFTDKNVHIENIKKSMGDEYKISLTYNNEVIDECISIFSSLGYTPVRNSLHSDGAINFRHPCEVKTPGGYFWYSTQPLVMNHPNKDRTISIFNLLKETKIGKKWLKNKTKEEQKHQLIKNNITKYTRYEIFNERYLNFDDTIKSEMIRNLLNSKNDVLKIKSAMGTAKSNGVAVAVQEAHKKGLKVLLISNRVTVAQDFAEKYNMMWYKDIDAWKQDQSLVVQFDSLHRFDIDKFDIVILDEFISLLFHHRGNLTGNANLNIIRFKLFMEKKRLLVADAFLTGFEDIFFENRNISMIDNNYRDDIKLIEYKNKEKFICEIIKEAKDNKTNKTSKIISVSFTSNNVMKAVDLELKKLNIKVVMLNAETPQHTKDIIFKHFKEFEHTAYDVILYSPTLTVGVSNLNNVDKHFHYDSGMSTDVISSLQMIKRSRTAKEIHYFLEERQFYFDTDVKSINSSAEANINNFYNNKDATLLIDVDYETGKLKLTELGKYVNKIEAFFNITKNNHANAFKILLDHQFRDNRYINDEEEKSFNIRDTIKEIKEKETQQKIKILKEWENKDFSSIDIDRLKSKTIQLSDDEKIQLLIGEIQDKFKNELSNDELIYLANKQIETNFKYIGMISKLRIARKAFASKDYSLFLLSQTVGSDISSLQNKSYIEFLEYISLISSTLKLKNRYSKNEIDTIDNHFNTSIKNSKGSKFLKFLKSIGYKKSEAKWFIDEKILYFSKKI